MSTLRMTSDLRRQLILGAAKRCFARNGFAGTTAKSVAAAAAISEALLVKHFPSKAENLIGSMFTASLEAAIASGDAARLGGAPLNLFWFAHHTVLTAALTRLPAVPCLVYGDAADLERQLCEFLLRGIGLNEAAI